jgi:hypothetical protein
MPCSDYARGSVIEPLTTCLGLEGGELSQCVGQVSRAVKQAGQGAVRPAPYLDIATLFNTKPGQAKLCESGTT